MGLVDYRFFRFFVIFNRLFHLVIDDHEHPESRKTAASNHSNSSGLCWLLEEIKSGVVHGNCGKLFSLNPSPSFLLAGGKLLLEP